MVFILVMGLALACAAADPLVGKWKVAQKGVDAANNECPFIPDEFEFFPDGTVAMSNMPGVKMAYKTKLSDTDAKSLMKKFTYLKDKKKILLMMPPGLNDWLNQSMAYIYSIKANELSMEIPGWSPSKFKRSN